jgi:outer membrane lipoprotein-sorting protein
MANEHEDKLIGRLAQAVRQLVETTCANDRPADLDVIVLSELSRADDSTGNVGSAATIQSKPVALRSAGTSASTPSRRRMMSLRNCAAVAAAVSAIVVLNHWIAPTGTSRSFAFADVQAQVAKTESVQYVETRTNHLNGQRLDGMIRRVKILGPHRMREELSETPGEVLSDHPNTESYVQIHDARNGIMVVLHPDRKSHEVVNHIMGIGADGRIVESKPEPNPKIDFYAHIREVPGDKAIELKDKFISGKLAKGFQVETTRKTPAGTDTFTKTYWVDPETKLPVRIETSLRSTNPNLAESNWVRTDIVFDQPLDESLFSTDPPPGYNLDAEVDETQNE